MTVLQFYWLSTPIDKKRVLMALIQCDECGSDLSTNAKTCPNCGFDQAEKHDAAVDGAMLRITIAPVLVYLVICLFGINFGFFDYSNAFFSHSFAGGLKSWLWGPIVFLFSGVGWNRHPVLGGWLNAVGICTVLWWTVDSIIPEDTGKEESMKASVNNSGWSTSATTDAMTEVKSYHAISNQTVSLEPLGFPYKDVKTYMGFSCQPSNGFQVYFVFNKTNIPKKRVKNGDWYIDARVKFDDNIDTYPLLLVKGKSNSLYFTNDSLPVLDVLKEIDSKLLGRLLDSQSILLELEYHDNGYVNFQYDLNGRDEIEKTLYDCIRDSSL